MADSEQKDPSDEGVGGSHSAQNARTRYTKKRNPISLYRELPCENPPAKQCSSLGPLSLSLMLTTYFFWKLLFPFYLIHPHCFSYSSSGPLVVCSPSLPTLPLLSSPLFSISLLSSFPLFPFCNIFSVFALPTFLFPHPSL